MKVIVNGVATITSANSTVQDLLLQLRLDSQQVVVERNRDIIPRQDFAVARLASGDVLEIVHFVGGG